MPRNHLTEQQIRDLRYGDNAATVATKVSEHDTALDAAETTIAGHTTTISGHTTTISGHTTTIGQHTTAIASKATYLGALTTAERPAASTENAGAFYLDTTVGKPVWSTGTAWVDGAGTAVADPE